MAQQGDSKRGYREGWLEHKGGSSKDKYNMLFISLKGRKLYIHADDHPGSPPMGSLSIDRFTTIKRKDKGGYKLELNTVSSKPTDGSTMTYKQNIFKAVTKADRDIWYAYLYAFVQLSLPSNVHLEPSDKKAIEEALQDCVRAEPDASSLRRSKPPRLIRSKTEPAIQVPTPPLYHRPSMDSGWPSEPPPPPPSDSHHAFPVRRPSVASEINQNRPLPAPPRSSIISSGSDSSERRSLTSTDTGNHSTGGFSPLSSVAPEEYDGPFQYHRFYTNRGNCHIVPTWFFENCTRDQSEMVLMMGKRYGNVMMRESTTYRQSGSYVIDVREETTRGSSIRHFEVIRVAQGFKINLLNTEHEPMSCLSEVMNFMTTCLGPEFRHMSTNDRSLIGLPTPEYDKIIPKGDTPTPMKESIPVDDDHYCIPETPHSGSHGTDEDDYAKPTDYMDMMELRKQLPQPAPAQYDIPRSTNPFYDAPPQRQLPGDRNNQQNFFV